MKRTVLLLLLAVAVPLLSVAQDKSSSGFGLDPSDAAAVASLRARMDQIRKHRPTVALVLSGGGAKGAATVGALQYLERYKFPVDMVVGTSIGGLIGGVYAMGYSPEFLDSLMRNMDWDRTMSDKVDWEYIPYSRRRYKERFLLSIPFYYSVDDYRVQLTEDVRFDNQADGRLHLSAEDEDRGWMATQSLLSSLPSGFIFGQNVQDLISSLTPRYADSTDFFRLPVPFACVATDIVSGKAKVWHSGSLNTAMRSTMSIPGLFAPVRTRGMVLVDGGMRNNFPVDLAREMGADIVIGVDLSDAKSGYTEIHNIADILWRGIDMFAEDSFSRNIRNVDVRIKPDLAGYGMMSFNKAAIDTMILRGYRAAEAKEEELSAVRRWLGKDTLRLAGPPAVDLGRQAVLIDSVEVAGVTEKDAQYIRTRLKIHAGDRVTRAQVEDAVNTIFGKGVYEYVSYEMLGTGEPFHLKINCKRGPKHLLGVGFRLDTEELVSLLLNVGLNTTAMRGSSLDLTARIGTNPYLDVHYAYETPKWPTFNVRADLKWTDHNNFLMGENRFNVAYLSTTQEVYASNMEWSMFDIKGGFRNLYFNIAHLLASDVIGDYDRSLDAMDYPGLFVDATAYSLDDGYFPKQGFSAHLRYDLVSRLADGPGYPPFFGIVSGSGKMPVPIGPRFTLIPQGGFRFIFGDDIPVPYANVLGGDMVGRYVDHQMPFIGIANAAFRRNNLVVLRADLRYQFLKNNYLTAVFNYSRDFYSFRKFETGENLYGAGLGYAYDSIVGPLKAQVFWSSLTRRVGAYVSLGFDF
ncbi:MAG: patatin-like phospholipase family protein [Bacteroidales bacterium]|nr:patatin-like phospholipase family protein [Bacteroidales bacterium]